MLQVAFSPRELKLVTAGDDSEVRVWDLTKKTCIATLKVSLQQSSLYKVQDLPPVNWELPPKGYLTTVLMCGSSRGDACALCAMYKSAVVDTWLPLNFSSQLSSLCPRDMLLCQSG